MRSIVVVLLVLWSGCDTGSIQPVHRPELVGSRSVDSSSQGPVSYPTDGLLAYFPFDGHASNVLSPLHRGQAFGTAYVNDRRGNSNSAVWFDGTNDYITISESNLLQVQLPVSLSFWVKPDQVETTSAALTTSFDHSGNTGVFAAFDSNGSNPSISIGGGGGFGIQTRRTLHAAVPLEPGQWYHIVGVVQSVHAMKIYVNAVNVLGHTDGGANELRYGDGPLTFGRRIASVNAPPIHFEGALDDVMIYGVALSPSDVTRLFLGE